MRKSYFLFAILTLIFFANNGISQESMGGIPLSFTATGLSDNFEIINLTAPDITEFTQEDIENDENNFPQRIAANVPVNIDIYTSGSWEKIKPGGKIWRVKLICDGALALNVQFDVFHLPKGGNLYLYNEEKSQVLGAFTSMNNHESGLFSTELIKGDAVIIEYYEPEFTNELVELSISDLAYAYRNVSFLLDNSEDFGDSDWCEVNVNCSPEGDNWQDEKRGVARILFKDGAWWYWCTGSLVNNTLEDGTPYFLTADHCGGTASASDRNQWIFYFNYESSGCSNPGSSPGYNSKTGATLKARGDIDGGSDFQLVQLNSTPASYYNVYYNGWDRSGSSSSSGVAIHHPAGDIKKISTYNSTLTSATWNGSGYIGATNAHWRAYWIATTNGHGVNEGGSSGSPIFNSSGRVLGTLTGGSSSCNNPYWSDLYGKFSYHWQSNGGTSAYQLKPWLDPNNSGVTYLNGYDPNAANPPVADFTVDNTNPAVGQPVNFTDLSTNSPTSWSWSFTPSTITYTGGTSSSSQNPQVQFNASGNYTVTLIATNSGGSDSETKTNYINVYAITYCFASGGGTYPHISGVQIETINNTSGQSYYADYTSLSTDITISQSYDITVTNGYVNPDNDLGVWIDWNQDDDFDDSGENVVCEVSNNGQGTYSFTVPVTALTGTTRMRIRTKYYGDDCGFPCGTTTYGEVEDYSVNVILGVDPPIADFEADNLTPGIGETVYFTDLSTNSPTSWSWTFTPSTVSYVGGTNSASQNPEVQFNAAGNYTVELTATNSGGSDTEIKTDYIFVVDVPVADFEADNTTPGIDETVSFTDLSTNSPDTWSWSFTPSSITYVGGTNSGFQNPQVEFDAPGDYTVELTASNASGSDSETKTDYIFVVDVPVADFEADNTTPGIGETVNFTDLSTNNPISWAWTFTPSTITYVGGTTTTDQNPQVQFDATGYYTVELTATNISGSDTETKVDYIFVIDIPDANFEADNETPGIGETVNFTDVSTNDPISWSWTFTPSTITYVGGTTSIDQNPQVQFDAAGYYTVELTATNISGSDTETKVDYIFVIDIPNADFEADNTTPGIGETVNFTDLSTNNPNSWAWTFTPSTITYVGGTTATDQNPQVQFDAAGYYTAELIATNISGNDTETKVDYIFVIDIPNADFEADNTTPGIGETVNFTDLSTNDPTSWAWTFIPSTITYVGGTTANSQHPQVQFDAGGNYTVELTATNISGSDTETKIDYISVVYIPDADFSADNLTPGIGETVNFTDLSTNDPTSWAWTFTPSTITYVGGTTANSQHPQVQFDAGGNYTVELTATNISGSDTETKIDYIFVADVPVANFEADNTTPGIGETVSFTDLSTNSPSSWAWTFIPSTITYLGGTTANSQHPQVQFDAGGNYTVELTATNISGSDTETKIDYIFVADVPVANFEADNTTPGIGETVSFTDLSTNSPSSWAWTFIPSTITYLGGTTANSQHPQVQFDAGGNYTIELTATNISGSDTETKTDYIFVVDVPVADFEADNTTPGIDETVSFTDLSTNSPDTWSWLFSPSIITYTGGTTSASQNPQVQFNAEGLYTVQLIATNISGSDTEIKTNYIDVSIPVYDLDITVFLEGPFNGSLMNSDLSSVLPLNQPYNVAPWNYNGSETVVSIPGSNIVDWVVVELRHALSAPQASSATILNQQAAFLRNDGQVVDLYGNPVLNFEEVVTNNLYVVIHHRIHLSIMSSTGLTETDGTFSYDFSTSVTKAYLSGQNLLGGGYSGMIGGNGVPQDNTVNSSDKSLWNSDAGTKGYLFSDYNLDGETNNPDKNDIWVPNEGKVSQVPD